MTDVWKALPLPPYRSYEISSEGAVRRRGRVRELVGYVDRYGYRTVLLSYAGLSRRFKVSRLVCEAFHGPAPDGHHAAHLNGNQSDDCADNLAWKTSAQNNADKLGHGTHQGGEKHPRAKLTADLVAQIRLSSLSCREAARTFGISKSQVSRIRDGQHWPVGDAENPMESAS